MFFQDTIATKKRMERRKNGLCEACGKEKCQCKSKRLRS